MFIEMMPLVCAVKPTVGSYCQHEAYQLPKKRQSFLPRTESIYLDKDGILRVQCSKYERIYEREV